MSSIVTIIPCKFLDVPFDEESYGYRIYDDYGSSYNNLWEEEDINLLPTEIVRKVCNDREGSDTVGLMFDFLIENELGIFVGNDWLEWEQIKEILT